MLTAELSAEGKPCGDGITKLFKREHDNYTGPVYRARGKLWIYYKDEPVEVRLFKRCDSVSLYEEAAWPI